MIGSDDTRNQSCLIRDHFLIDDTFLAENGVTDFEPYRVDPTQKLVQDFFVPADSAPPKGVMIDVPFR